MLSLLIAVLVLSGCLLGAFCGWLGGRGGTVLLRAKVGELHARIVDLEKVGAALDRRVRSAYGERGAEVQRGQRGEAAQVEAEARALLAQMRGGPARPSVRPVPDDPAAASAEAHEFFSRRDAAKK